MVTFLLLWFTRIEFKREKIKLVLSSSINWIKSTAIQNQTKSNNELNKLFKHEKCTKKGLLLTAYYNQIQSQNQIQTNPLKSHQNFSPFNSIFQLFDIIQDLFEQIWKPKRIELSQSRVPQNILKFYGDSRSRQS